MSRTGTNTVPSPSFSLRIGSTATISTEDRIEHRIRSLQKQIESLAISRRGIADGVEGAEEQALRILGRSDFVETELVRIGASVDDLGHAVTEILIRLSSIGTQGETKAPSGIAPSLFELEPDERPRSRTNTGRENEVFGKLHPRHREASEKAISFVEDCGQPVKAKRIMEYLRGEGGIPEFRVGTKDIGNRLIQMGLKRVFRHPERSSYFWPQGKPAPKGFS